MTGPGRRFDPSELSDDGAGSTDAEYAELQAAARELEALAARDMVMPTADFDDRVMAAIAAEAPPRVIVASGGGILGRLAAFAAALGSAWRVATSGGRPMIVRAQALAFVLLVVLAGGSLASVATIGAVNLLTQPSSPTPRVAPIKTAPPTPTVTPPDGPVTTQPGDGPAATETPEATETSEPSESPEASDDHETAEPKTPKPTSGPRNETPRPTRTPRAEETPEPSESEEPDGTDDPGGGGSGSGSSDHGGSGPG